MLIDRVSSFVGGFVLGVGTGLVLRNLAPHLKSVTRPIMKGLVQTSKKVKDGMQEIYYSGAETLDDLFHEVKDQKKTKKKVKKKNSTKIPMGKTRKREEAVVLQ